MHYTISDVLTVANDEFALAKLDHEILLANLLDLGREKLMAHPEYMVTENQRNDFLLDCQRRDRGEPIAYIVGYKEFFGLHFEVDRRVLIPRPETELLVESALEELLKDSSATICDVGTGSGCISVSLAVNRKNLRVKSLDISTDALMVARKNLDLHDVADRVELVESNLLSAVKDEKFEGIVANLPYIGRLELEMVDKDVLDYEPNLALFSGEDGLDLYTEFFDQLSKMHLPRWCIGEIGFAQFDSIKNLVKKFFPGASLEFKSDLAGIKRIFIIRFV